MLPVRFRFLHHTGNTAPETRPLYFGPIDGDKTTEATLYRQLDRTFARYRRPDELINVLNRLNVRSDDTHFSFQINR